MKPFKTPKGTTLKLMDIKGKEYLPVAQRIIWFREEHPDWSIETDCVSNSTETCIFRALIKNELGRIISMAHKRETKQGFHDFEEKAETGAIGRALALCGFGTQFATDDLDEGNRIVDSPQSPTISHNAPPHFMDDAREEIPDFESLSNTPPKSAVNKKESPKFTGGKHIGKTFDHVKEHFPDYVDWVRSLPPHGRKGQIKAFADYLGI